MRYVFYPRWNLTINDADFYLCQVENSLTIEVTIGELIDEFLQITKYGLLLRGWDSDTMQLFDEPIKGQESVLTIQLKVEKDLEPKWHVICERNKEGVPFKSGDRMKVGVNLIGQYADRQLAWSRGSTLTKLTHLENIAEPLTSATRSAKDALDSRRKDLANFDAAAKTAEKVARELGVPVSDKYQAHLDMGIINLKVAGLALHDGNVPLRQLGLGSRRMLTCGLQKHSFQQSHITLFDEVEIGLEPHRIARLLKNIKEDNSGQYFLTTHSPVALRELTIDDLYIVHNVLGSVRVVATADKELDELNIQGKIRSSAEAFLAAKIVVCEGATEAGFVRGLDNYWLGMGFNSFSLQGVAILDGRGASNIKVIAQGLKSLSYDVAVVVDGDAPSNFSEQDANSLKRIGVEVIMWNNKLSLEERAMIDLPWSYVIESVKLAKDEFSRPVYDNIRSKLNNDLDKDENLWEDSYELRVAIGQAAKSSSWFKSITKGEIWVEVISPALIGMKTGTDLKSKIQQLREWVDHA